MGIHRNVGSLGTLQKFAGCHITLVTGLSNFATKIRGEIIPCLGVIREVLAEVGKVAGEIAGLGDRDQVVSNPPILKISSKKVRNA